jgi:hypothetical protein
MDILQSIMPATLYFGEPTTIHGFGILPIINDQPNTIIPLLVTLDEALERGEVIIREVSEGAQVPYVLVENKANELVILEGECLIGLRQNRVVNTTVIVEARASIRIAVSCIQQKRWSDNGLGELALGKSLFRASSRAVHKRGVTEGLHREGIPLSNQIEVWEEVQRSLNEFGVYSRTADYQDAGERVAHRIEDIVQAIHPVPNQTGAIFFGDRGVIGTELLATPDLFSRSFNKIISSFAMDRISAPPPHGISIDSIKSWWNDVLASSFSKHNSIGVGVDIRTEAPNLIGSGLAYKGMMIHFSCFPSSQPLQERRYTAGNRASARDRRRKLRSNIGE